MFGRQGVQCRFKLVQYDSCKGCTALGVECNWTRIQKPQSLPDTSYIRYLESKIRGIEAYLKRTYPRIKTKGDIDDLIEREIGNFQAKSVSVASGTNLSFLPADQVGIDLAESPTLSRFVRGSRLAYFGSLAPVSDENVVWQTKSANLYEHRYYGHSSTCVLSRDAIFFRHDYHSDRQPSSSLPSGDCLRAKFWTPTAIEMKRLQQPYELWETEHTLLELPPDDLMPILLNSYFDNTFIPVVHRQLFEKQLREAYLWILPDTLAPDRKPLSSSFINMWAGYYELLISINRPFISKTSELAASSLAICREAAKAFAKM
ncbi:unnamed protein product, partial [Rhizoctonia solani]